MGGEADDRDDPMALLVRAYVACQLAEEAVARLPPDLRDTIDGPLQAFCAAVKPHVEHLLPESRTS